MLTIVILTKNEAERLPKCLRAIPSKYPIVVVDSGSQDKTVSIAERHGCAVYFQKWLGFSGQRNFALQHCGIQTGWVLFIDADELYPKEFFTWFEGKPSVLENIDVLMVPSCLIFNGKRLKHAPGYPIYHPRLVRSGTSPFVVGHAGHTETLSADVKFAFGDIAYDHHFFNGDLKSWMIKHLSLARMEVSADRRTALVTFRTRMSLLAGKNFLRVPGRFIYHYLIRGGIYDGWCGFHYSLMYAWYELTKYLLVQRNKRDQTIEI